LPPAAVGLVIRPPAAEFLRLCQIGPKKKICSLPLPLRFFSAGAHVIKVWRFTPEKERNFQSMSDFYIFSIYAICIWYNIFDENCTPINPLIFVTVPLLSDQRIERSHSHNHRERESIKRSKIFAYQN